MFDNPPNAALVRRKTTARPRSYSRIFPSVIGLAANLVSFQSLVGEADTSEFSPLERQSGIVCHSCDRATRPLLRADYARGAKGATSEWAFFENRHILPPVSNFRKASSTGKHRAGGGVSAQAPQRPRRPPDIQPSPNLRTGPSLQNSRRGEPHMRSRIKAAVSSPLSFPHALQV